MSVSNGPAPYRARCWYRGQDGRKHQIDIERRTKSQARKDAFDLATERANIGNVDLNPNSPLRDLMAVWWETTMNRRDSGEIAEGTVIYYRKIYDRIEAGIGHHLIRDCRPLALQKWMKEEAGEKPSVYRGLRLVLNQIFARGVQLQVIEHNPAAAVDAPNRKKRDKPEALTSEEAVRLRKLVRDWEAEHVNSPNVNKDGKRTGGRRPLPYIADVVDVLLGTGLRISEVLGLRWEDIDLKADAPTLTVNGAVKARKKSAEHGSLVWEPRPKSRAGHRTIPLPDLVVSVLMQRHLDAEPGAVWVFASENGTPRYPANVRTRLRRVCGTTFEGLTPHTLRRTMATIVEEEGGLRAASMILGHSSTAITEQYYVHRSSVAPDMSRVLDAALGGDSSR